jgi:hypothetical protein
MVSALVVVLSLLGEHGLSSNMVQPDRIVVADVCNDVGGSPSWVEQHLSLGLGMQCAAAAAHVVVDGYAVNAMLPLDSNDTTPLISSPYPYNNSAQESTAQSFLLHNTTESYYQHGGRTAPNLYTAASTNVHLVFSLILLLIFFNPRLRRFIAALLPWLTLAWRYSGALASVPIAYSLPCLSWMLFLVCYPYRWFGPSPVVDYAFMLMGDDDVDNNWDARKFPKCKPFHGGKGALWERFVDDFGVAMQAIIPSQIDGCDLMETMLGTDVGGDVYMSTPDGAGNIPAVLDAAALSRRRMRLKVLATWLYTHVADLRLREQLKTEALSDGRRGFLLLDQQCRSNISDFEERHLNIEWEAATIISCVGFNINSILLFSRHLKGLNNRRPLGRKKSDDEMAMKLLASIPPRSPLYAVMPSRS